MQIEVNGHSREVDEGMTVSVLIEQLEMDPRYLAVERNRQLVPRAEHATTQLAAGDRLEVVTLVGGG